MEGTVKNYRRFYAAFNKLQHYGNDEEQKRGLIETYTQGRTTHLREMTSREYVALCKGLEDMLGYGEKRKRHRSICLHLMQEVGVDTKDWQRINDFCQHPRIAGKVFALLDISELEVLELKLRAIKRKGGLKKSEEGGVKRDGSSCTPVNNKSYLNIIIVNNGTERTKQATSAAGRGGQLPS